MPKPNKKKHKKNTVTLLYPITASFLAAWCLTHNGETTRTQNKTIPNQKNSTPKKEHLELLMIPPEDPVEVKDPTLQHF
jgi:hypothetical protein